MSNSFTSQNENQFLNRNVVRNIRIIRNESGYGFTLSRYTVQDSQTNQFYQQKGSLLSSSSNSSFQQSKSNTNPNENNLNSYEIVFVKHVKVGGAAYIAGLREGDRPICINNIPLSDKTYSDIISIIEQSGIVLDLKVIASSSTSTSLQTYPEQTKNSFVSNSEKINFDIQPVTRSPNSNSQFNFTNDNQIGIQSSLNSTQNFSSLSDSQRTKTNRNTIGLGPLGMSALFYSLLKNNAAKHTGSPVDSGYDSRHDSTFNTSSILSNKTSPSLYQAPQMEKFNSNSNQTNLAQIKLKNLQEAIARNYSKEEFSNYGIVIPNSTNTQMNTSKSFSSNDKENLNNSRQMFNNYNNSGSIDNPNSQKLTNYSTLSTMEGSPVNMNRNQDYRYSNYQRTDDEHKPKSPPLKNPYYYDPKLSYSFDTKPTHPFFQSDLANMKQNRPFNYNQEQPTSFNNYSNYYSPYYQNYQTSSAFNSTSPPLSALSPVSQLSSNSVLSSSSAASSNSSNSTVSQAQTNTTSTLNYFHDCESSLVGSSFNLNKSSPTMFSKYIETVHKALYDTGNPKEDSHRYRSLSAASSDLTALPSDFPLINKPKIITTNQDSLNSQQVSKQFVENRRQIFEKTNKIENKFSSDKSLNRKPSLRNQNNLSFDETIDLERTPTPTKLEKKSESFSQGQKPASLERFVNSSPIRGSTARPNSNENREPNNIPLGQRSLAQFNHANRASYKGECKRLMSRAHLETVAERAAHFEDVDPERYEKLKSKFAELDLSKQDEIHLLLLQHQQHQQQILQNALRTKNNNLSSSQLNKNKLSDSNKYLNNNSNLEYSIPNENRLDSKWNSSQVFNNQNYPVQHVNNRTPQSQLNSKYHLNNMSSSLINNNKNIYEQNSFQVDNSSNQYYNDSNDELIANNFKMQQLMANSKRRSITSSPIRKTTSSLINNNSKTSHHHHQHHQTNPPQTFEFDSNGNNENFRRSNLNEGSNSSHLVKSKINKNSKNSKANNQKRLVLNSDAGETTSTDSDIGTSPSGTTLASPPSSPQQPQQTINTHIYYQQNTPSHTDSPKTRTPSLSNYSSIIRQHSYLNAVQLNDFKLNKLMQSSNFMPINENDPKVFDFLNPASVPYYYSPSSTVMRQQKLLQLQQQQQQQQQQKLTSTPSIKDIERSISSNRTNNQSLSIVKDDDDVAKKTPKTIHNDSDPSMSKQRVKSVQVQSRHPLQQLSISAYSSSNQDSDDTRRKKAQITSEQKLQKNSHTPRNTSIKKLKSFFGEKTPVVLQAVENKNIIASDEFLSQINETIKEGVLNCKIVLKDGKRSTDRSWRPAWAVLKKSGELFLCKEKKDNIMIPSVETSYPINIKNSLIDIAYDYTKRKNVFKIRSVNSEYLFQTLDHDAMLEWIRIMQESSNQSDSIDKLVTSINQSSNSKNWPSSNPSDTNSLDLTNYSTPSKIMNVSNELINSSPDDSYTRQQKQIIMDADVSPRRENRKWVRQMTRRIRDFMTNTNTDQIVEASTILTDDYLSHNRNFGIALERCEPSTLSIFIPVVIEICTRLIEIHIIDEGIYRKVGQKQVVLALRSQLNNGVLNIDVSDYNWDNPHAVVSLLKCFLNELPDSLTTSLLYNEFIQICRYDNHQIRIIGIKKLLNRLPKHNYETLKYLTAHLRRVAAAYQHNKMTIKNLSIAFSQSIIRHNDANCETIRSDHLLQSFLIEIILSYHDWLFDQSQNENIPNEIKDSAEQHLSQQFCSYIEPISYSDLLINIMKLLKSKWNSTNSTLNTPPISQNSNDSGYYSNSNTSRQPINIQFKSEKSSLRSSKSVTTINRSRAITQAHKASKQSKGLSLKQSFIEAKQRSRSVDTRFKPLGFIFGFNSSSLNQTVNSYDLETGLNQSNRKKLFKKNQKISEPKFLDDSLIKLKTYENKETALLNKAQKSTPMARKSYADAIKSKLNTDETIINFKELEKKNQADLERLNKLMKKLEIDLINAQMELIEEDYLKLDSSKSKYFSSSMSSSSSTSGVVVGGSSSSCISASPMFRNRLKCDKSSKLCSLSSISSSSEDFSVLSPKVNSKKKIVRRHTISGKLDNYESEEEESRDDLLNYGKKFKKSTKKSNKLNSKSIAELPSLTNCEVINSKKKFDCTKYEKEEQNVQRTILNLSPLSISASSVSSTSSSVGNSTMSLGKTRLRKIAGSNLADEVGSIGLAVSQLASESLL